MLLPGLLGIVLRPANKNSEEAARGAHTFLSLLPDQNVFVMKFLGLRLGI